MKNWRLHINSKPHIAKNEYLSEMKQKAGHKNKIKRNRILMQQALLIAVAVSAVVIILTILFLSLIL